jgi:DNA-binding TFAR19-related protein (PDSD5 family)
MAAEERRRGSDRLARLVLRAPGFVRRAAASQAQDAQEAWMLGQPRAVRESFVREVLDRGADERLAEIWMLRQPSEVRESYVRDVLEPALPPELR